MALLLSHQVSAEPLLSVAPSVPVSATSTEATLPQIDAASQTAESPAASAPITRPPLAVGTPIRLMILREVNSNTARSGDRIKLRVVEPVFLNGVPVVPIGATAWAEVIAVEKNGAVGKPGKLGARLRHLEMPDGPVPLRGEHADKGDGNSAGVVLAIVGFGLLGLLTEGDSARLKAGDLITGYVDGKTEPVVPSNP